MSTRFLPISCTSPLTVARIILPLVAVSVFSMNGSRYETDAFIASALCSTSATISSLLLNRRPTSSIPSISGPLMMSSGLYFLVLRPDLEQPFFCAFDNISGQPFFQGQLAFFFFFLHFLLPIKRDETRPDVSSFVSKISSSASNALLPESTHSAPVFRY